MNAPKIGTYRLLPVGDLKRYERNARTHPEAQIEQIVRSVREFGFTNPLLVDEKSNIIAGHGRLDAALRLEMGDVPCIVLEGLTAAQRRALVIADNQIALNAGWDLELLSGELQGLRDLGFDLELTGFSLGEIDKLLAPAGLTDPDEVPDAPVNPVAKLGDVWLLGKHRLVCGDCTDAAVVDKALAGAKPHLMVTDPPYGVDYDASWRNRAVMIKGERPGAHGGKALGKVENDANADWRAAWALFPGDAAYIWHAGVKAPLVADSLICCGFQIRSQIIWAKQHLLIGRGNYHWKHEPCWYAVRKGATGHWQGDRKQSTLWEIDKPQKSETGHSTQKPVECMRRPIENNSKAGDAVYEPFSGSGTTIIAATMTGRRCHAIELNPAYVDVAVIRWQNFTGQAATREQDGEPFKEAA